MDENGVDSMTEERKNPRRRLRRFWENLKAGICPGITQEPRPLLSFDRNKMDDMIQSPGFWKAATESLPPVQLMLNLDEHGYGSVLLNGQEVDFVRGIHLDVRPGEPVNATIEVDAKSGLSLSATKAVLVIQQSKLPVPGMTDICDGCGQDRALCGACMRGGHGNTVDFYKAGKKEVPADAE